jgi:DNA-binding GntR family transcriptional regulator
MARAFSDNAAVAGEALLARLPVARASALPLHAQCREHLVELIEGGALAPGVRLPPERELAAAWGVSLAPVRQAILDLVGDGYLYRVRGSGTYVRATKVEEKLSIVHSFTQTLQGTGMQAEVRLLQCERTAAPPAVLRALGARGRNLLLVERLGLLGGEPVAHLAAYLAPRAATGLTAKRLEGASLYELLAAEGIELQRADSMIEVIRCSAEQATLLGLERGAPALLVEGTTFDQHDRPIEYTRVVYRADRFRFSLESHHRQADRVVHVISPPPTGEGHVKERVQ